MAKSTELTLSKPVSFWNKNLTFDARSIFGGLGKAAVKLASLKFDEVAEEVVEVAAGLGLEISVQEVAFNLIRRSLSDALVSLTKESASHIPFENSNFETFDSELEDVFGGLVINFNNKFFDNPAASPFLVAISEAYFSWLYNAGASELESRLISARIGAYFVKSLSSEWVRNRSYYSALLDLGNSPFSRAEAEIDGWKLYFSHLRLRISESIFDEPFGLSQIYVPLNGYYQDGGSAADSMSPEARERPRRVCIDLREEIKGWLSLNNKSDAIRVISGGPGCGKSSFTKVLCCELAEQGLAKPIYIPLHLIDPTKDVAAEVARFVSDEGLLGFNPLESDRKEENLLLVFDGLDELASMGKSAVQVARDFVQAVGRMVERRNIGTNPIFVIISGREVIVQGNETEFRQPRQVLNVLPYYLDRVARAQYYDPQNLLRVDLRDLWWRKYGQLTGADYQVLPPPLKMKEIDEITAQPLLNYLVALSFRRGKLDFDSGINLNNVYADLVAAVYERAYEKSRTYRPISHLKFSEFVRVLEEVGLAAWHGSDGRSTSVKEIMSHCQEGGLESLLTSFTEGAEAGVTKLLAAFFFRRNGQSVGEDAAFVFTHKSFGEYLTAARLVRGVEKIVQQRLRRRVDPDDGLDIIDALSAWLKLAGPAPMTEYLRKFVGREIARRPKEVIEQWQDVLCELFTYVVDKMMPVECIGGLTYSKACRFDSNASVALLIVLNACSIYLKAMASTKFSTSTSFGNFLKRTCPQRNGPQPPLVYSALSYFDFSGQCLDIVDWYGADISNSSFEGCDLHFSNFGRAVIVGVNFHKAKANWSYFDGHAMHSSNFSEAEMRGVDFGAIHVRGCNFAGAKMLDCKFPTGGIHDCDFTDAFIPGARVSGCNKVSKTNFSGVKIYNRDRYLVQWISRHIGRKDNTGAYVKMDEKEVIALQNL